jgi:GH15 family glucan-1,4-alpha-glucosidase
VERRAGSCASVMTCPVDDYALIGDRGTAALVNRDGSIDWLCWPRFDSAACFAALLGSRDNGRWLIGAADPQAHVRRCYRDNTLILETAVETADGAATVVDFMPPRDQASAIVRLVSGKRGRIAMRTELIIRFDYGSLTPWVTRLHDGSLRAIAGPDMVVLRTPAPLRGVDFTTVGDFTISAGETVPFVLSYGPSHLPPPRPIDPAKALAATDAFWSQWIGQAEPAGEWSEAVSRSLITLKALSYQPSGAIAAAPTTSLPEHLGGTRNWDYRYCWLRDATFTLVTLMNAGYYDDARAWREWLLRAVAGDPARVQIMYGMTGEHRLREWEVPWLAGYGGAKPVRVGNAAHQQLQLDVYGELMDALHHGRAGKLEADETGWALQQELLRHLELVWKEPDHGIWEVRGVRRQFTHSKVMAWVAFDRAVKSVEQFGMDGPADRWRALRDGIHEEICRFGFNTDLGAFVQSYGSEEIDASALLIPLVGFLPAHDARVRSTVEVVLRRLLVDGLVRRYDSASGIDGLPPGEGVFIPCSFWLADNLILLGRRAEARRLFERLLSLRNDVGLLSEEYDVHTQRLLGNFPQAFSHVALIDTAYVLTAQPRHRRHESGRSAPEIVTH